MKDRKSETLSKIAAYASVEKKEKMQVMYFEAENRQFRSNEIAEMATALRAFRTPPRAHEIDSGSSDECMLYTKADVPATEAHTKA